MIKLPFKIFFNKFKKNLSIKLCEFKYFTIFKKFIKKLINKREKFNFKNTF